jgi:hypothetical protein
MGQAAADRPAIADLVMRDMGNGLLQEWMRHREPPVVLDVAPAHEGAEPHAGIVANADVAEPGKKAQVDQQAWGRQPQGEDRHQALSTGDHGCVGIGPKQTNGLPEARRRVVVEGRGLHFHASQDKAGLGTSGAPAVHA